MFGKLDTIGLSNGRTALLSYVALDRANEG